MFLYVVFNKEAILEGVLDEQHRVVRNYEKNDQVEKAFQIMRFFLFVDISREVGGPRRVARVDAQGAFVVE